MKESKGRKRREGRSVLCSFPGSNYSDEELEFILAVEHWKRKNNVLFPTFTDILAIAKSLGYRKVGDKDNN